MRFLAPQHTPGLSHMLADLGHPSPREVSRYLQVTERTVFRWLADDAAPHAAMLALFWLTSYGLSELDCFLVDEIRTQNGLSDSLRHSLQKMTARVAWLEKNGQFGTANQPFMEPLTSFRVVS